jgi:two-component system, cell cycle sensor histidine kinase and response regulator CckA
MNSQRTANSGLTGCLSLGVHRNQPVVLIADDERAIQNMVRNKLEEEGYFVLTAENGEAALILSHQYPGRIHLLLTDIVMPNMSGVELSKQLSAERPGIRIVLMSGYFEEDINPEFRLLKKPFALQELTDTIKGLLPPRHKPS